MSILDLHGDDLMAAASRYVKPLAPEPKFSAWSTLTAVPRGAAEAVLQVSASATELAQAPVRRRGLESADGAMSNDFSEVFRQAGRDLRPDPETGHAAEQLIYQFARGATKIVAGAVAAGPAGVVVAGLEEANTQADELKRQGVDLQTRAGAGLAQGAGLALAALPVVGQTLRQTAALYVAGGPGGFVAGQALTREILQRGGYERIGSQFDPLDPVGLAVSALVPAVFAGVGIRGQRAAAAAKAAEDFRTGPVPSEPTATASAAREALSPEVVDAARVAFAVERRAASNPGDLVRGADAHETALARAEEAISRGEPVQVVDVAPPATSDTRTANFRAWFGDSKVVDEAGEPLVVYHGTDKSFDQFSKDGVETLGFPDKQGFYFTPDASYAEAYGGTVMPVYLTIRNPYRAPRDGYEHTYVSPTRRAALEAEGYDGVMFAGDDTRPAEIIVFRPEQAKSAIGNSGRFDPNSPSLTDPITEWGRTLQTTLDEARAEAGLPSVRDSGTAPAQDAQAAPAPTGKPRDLQTEQIALRKQDAVLKKLLECLNG
jgi:hypothetical protein